MDDETMPATEPDDTAAPDVATLLAEREAELERERASHRLAIERLRTAWAASEPGIDLALIRGDTIEEVEASFEAAKAIVARVREAVRRETAIPAGAPGRIVQSPSTPLEKIRAGLARIS